MKILGIETSCDETGVAVYDSVAGLQSHVLYSQIALHQKFGGVVPELAARDHVRRLLPLVQAALTQAGTSWSALTGIAYTAGPGLLSALLVGSAFAKSLAYALQIPTVAVHHLEGHLLSPFLADPNIQFPFLALLVSGGHTLLMEVQAVGEYRLLGETLDDAVGEAFDKTAKLLGLPYPGGAELAKLALTGNPKRYSFPRPMTQHANFDFSFSGLKTSVSLVVRSEVLTPEIKADIAASFQAAVVETLVIKTERALKATGLKRLVVAGGVSANQELRRAFNQLAGVEAFYPPLSFCTDNGAMIAYAGYQQFLRGAVEAPLEILVHPRWAMT